MRCCIILIVSNDKLFIPRAKLAISTGDLITDPSELLSLLELSSEQLLSGAILASEKFKLRVPRAFVGKMNAKTRLTRFCYKYYLII